MRPVANSTVRVVRSAPPPACVIIRRRPLEGSTLSGRSMSPHPALSPRRGLARPGGRACAQHLVEQLDRRCAAARGNLVETGDVANLVRLHLLRVHLALLPREGGSAHRRPRPDAVPSRAALAGASPRPLVPRTPQMSPLKAAAEAAPRSQCEPRPRPRSSPVARRRRARPRSGGRAAQPDAALCFTLMSHCASP